MALYIGKVYDIIYRLTNRQECFFSSYQIKIMLNGLKLTSRDYTPNIVKSLFLNLNDVNEIPQLVNYCIEENGSHILKTLDLIWTTKKNQ